MQKFKDIWNDRIAINSKRRTLIHIVDELLKKFETSFSQVTDLQGCQSDLQYVSQYLLRNESGFQNYAAAIDYVERFIGINAQKVIHGVVASSIQSLVDELQKKTNDIESELGPVLNDPVISKMLNEISALGSRSQVLKVEANSVYGLRTANAAHYSRENHAKVFTS